MQDKLHEQRINLKICFVKRYRKRQANYAFDIYGKKRERSK